MIVKGDESFFEADAQKRKKLFGYARIFAGYQVSSRQRFDGPGGDVAEVADRRGDNV